MNTSGPRAQAGTSAPVVLRDVVGVGREVGDEQPQAPPHLGRRQPDAVGGVHGLDHVVDQRLELGAVALDLGGALPEDGLAVGVNRQDHGMSGVGNGRRTQARGASEPGARGSSPGFPFVQPVLEDDARGGGVDGALVAALAPGRARLHQPGHSALGRVALVLERDLGVGPRLA